MKRAIIVSFSLLLSISLYCQFTDELFPIERTAITLGYLHGGGGIVGSDIEYMVGNRIGLQAGIGYISYGFGLNYHLKSGGVRSSFINLGYWHQGIGDSYAQSVFGPSIVYRARKILQAQIGLGVQLDKAPAMIDIPIMLLYSLGIYIPVR